LTRKRQQREQIAAPLIAAFEDAWAAIRAKHSDVPAAVIITGSGADGRRRGLKLGHYAADAWSAGKDAGICEIFIGGEGLQRGGRDVLGTLLHEAAHAIAGVRDIQDTSRQGRYHNVKFKELGNELGLIIEKDPRIGWSLTTVPDTTAEEYAPVVTCLDDAIRLFRQAKPKPPSKKAPPPCVCKCGRKIRVAPKVLERAPIICGACKSNFEPAPEPEPEPGA
jgi:hypothetical protein